MDKEKIIEIIRSKMQVPSDILDSQLFCNLVTKEILEIMDKEIGRQNYCALAELSEIILRLTRESIVALATWNQRLYSKGVGNTIESPQLCIILTHLFEFANVSLDGSTSGTGSVLMVYDESEGIYTKNMRLVEKAISELTHGRATEQMEKNVLFNLKAQADVKPRCTNPKLIPVGNGVFDSELKKLIEYSPTLVFTSKSPVNYNPKAKNVKITNPDGTKWDVEAWMKSLSDDLEIQQLLWEVIAAAIRPGVNWDKAVWFYSNQGNNGKGTLAQLIRNVCGEHNCASIPVKTFDERFGCSLLIDKSVVVTDENDINEYIDRSANYKACVTGDALFVDIKNAPPVSTRFLGLVVQCMNGFPKTKDKTSAFYRRLLLVPFEKSFTGVERKYIKHDYLYRKDVLEYVLKKVLEMDVIELSVPKACQTMLEEYQNYNNSISEYWLEFREQFVWDLLPSGFLYDLYVSWYRANFPSGKVIGKPDFLLDLKEIISKDSDWEWRGERGDKVKTARRMQSVENLIIEYDLKNWMNTQYKGNDTKIIADGKRKDSYRGVLRK